MYDGGQGESRNCRRVRPGDTLHVTDASGSHDQLPSSERITVIQGVQTIEAVKWPSQRTALYLDQDPAFAQLPLRALGMIR